jgi:hydroxymethylpyrimidine pyrophosphatase-like HAD family hydrolase
VNASNFVTMTARDRPNDARARHIRFSQTAGGLRAFATDLDRTLLTPGTPPSVAARKALASARHLGLRVLLVSGRRYSELRRYARAFGPLDGIVAENGAVVEAPVGSTPRMVGRRTGDRVRSRIRAVPTLPATFGEVVASVPQSFRPLLRTTIADLPVHLVGNVGHLMVLPRNVTKSSGTRIALRRLGLAGAAYAAIGDAENDIDLLRGARLSGAVKNAEPVLRSIADYVCHAAGPSGVLEFVEGPLARYVASRTSG